MGFNLQMLAFLIITMGICFFISILCFLNYHDSLPPFPVKHIIIDISGRRNVDKQEEFEKYLLEHGLDEFTEHEYVIKSWKKACEEIIEKTILKKRRKEDFRQMLGQKPICISYIRKQTRYKQSNYVRTAYVVDNLDFQVSLTFADVIECYQKLREINFETTTRKWNSKEQRSLMTSELRLKIKERDKYTCQVCGKYMPDEVGIHINHIIPISKGGKTVPSNLRVLCDKCNFKKTKENSNA